MTMTPDVLAGRNNGVMDQPHDDPPDPAPRPRRRTFTADYKRQILDEYDAADRDGRGALLRREGLYSSHISEWRKAAERGALAGLGTRPRRRSAEQVELDNLRRRNERLENELKKTRLALEITGKAHALLELLSESADEPPRSSR